MLALTLPCRQISIRAAESESESESVGVGSRSRQNPPTPTDSGQRLIRDSQEIVMPIRALSVQNYLMDWLDNRYRTQPCAALHSRHGKRAKFRT